MADETKRPMTDARKKANTKYDSKAYDKILLRVRAGRKSEMEAHAAQYQKEVGEIGKAGYSPAGSMQGFINRAIDETMERDVGSPSQESGSTISGTRIKKPPDDYIKLTDEEKAHIEKRRVVMGQAERLRAKHDGGTT
ncbi:MAG: hypothetical protein FWC70_11230 [Defluviitaleaceae bacterium]|nr:hypothetical protein [Defluviitaleaceae bacterium]